MVVMAAIAIGSAIGGVISGGKAKKAKKQARAAQLKINRISNFQQKRKFLRNFRAAQSVAVAQGIGSGAGLESSRTQGALASNTAQARGASLEQEEQAKQSEIAAAQLDKADSAAFTSSVFSSVSRFATSAGGQDILSKIPGLGAKDG